MPKLSVPGGETWLIPAVLTVLHVTLAAFAFSPAPHPGGDDAAYLALARSLIERHDYTNIWHPGLSAHTVYPPVFPAIVAVGLSMGLSASIGLKLMMSAITAAAVFASCFWIRRATTPGIALVAGLFVAISPELLRIGRDLLSDIPFWLFTILALVVWRKAASTDHSDGESRSGMEIRWVTFASGLSLIAYFTRSAGAPLLAAACVWLAIRRDWRALMVLAGFGAPLVFAWWLRGHTLEAGGYLAPFLSVDPYDPLSGTVAFTDLLVRVEENIRHYVVRHVPRLFTGTLVNGSVVGGLVCAVALVGWLRRLRKPSLAEIFVPVYLVLILLWPSTWSGPRLLLPVVPLIALYATELIAAITARSTWPRVAATLTLIGATALVVPEVVHRITDAAACRAEFAKGNLFPCTDRPFREFLEVATASKGKLPEGSVVLSRKPTVFFLHSGYRSAVYPFSAEPDSFFLVATRSGARFVVVDQLSSVATRHLQPVLHARSSRFCQVEGLAHGKTSVMKIGAEAGSLESKCNPFRP
ncbi:MAG: ArnT family glycosyltransferase [Gemmatimonadaceae bacterium]